MDKTNTYCFPDIESAHLKAGKSDRDSGSDRARSKEEQLAENQSHGYEQGRCEGRDKALENEKQRLQPLSNLLEQASEILDSHYAHLHKQAPQMAVRLAVTLADKIIHEQLDQQPELIDHMVSTALQTCSGMDGLKLKVNPEDSERIHRFLADHCHSIAEEKTRTISSDPSIKKGGCMIETDFGVVDARINKQMATLAGALETALNESHSHLTDFNDMANTFKYLGQTIEKVSPIKVYGHVTKVVGLVVEANGPAVQLGSICDIYGTDKSTPIAAEVLGFRDRTVLMMPLEEIRSIGPGSRVVARQQRASALVGDRLLGRVIDGLGNPIDGKGAIQSSTTYPLYANPINPLLRQRIRAPLDIGIRAINGLITIGCGQRMGIFAGSGVGKSVLMGMIARKSKADVNVIALIGERGRELNEFIDKELGTEGLKKSVVVVATSDHLPLVRVRGAFVATAIAEYFRDQGLTVNLMMDSLTRFAMAQREIGLALGEPPTTKGYTPSVFTLLPRLLERAGTSDHSGSITGLYTVLVEGDDMNDPIADAARSILDGHVVLSRDLAARNHYPAIDVLKSISRVMEDIAPLQHKHNAGRLKEMLATYQKAEDLINIGAYVAGNNPAIDRAVANIDAINGYLCQGIQDSVTMEESTQLLDTIISPK
jgi:flagellum-specific ATP synthase